MTSYSFDVDAVLIFDNVMNRENWDLKRIALESTLHGKGKMERTAQFSTVLKLLTPPLKITFH